MEGFSTRGELTIINGSISNNSAPDATFSAGGAIYNSIDATLDLTNVSIQNNTANSAGGVFTLGPTTIQNSQFISNTARESAGALLLSGTLGDVTYRIYSSRFEENTATEGGGAILAGNEPVEIFGSVFVGNRVEMTGSGGAILNFSGEMNIQASVFDDNRAMGTAVGGAVSNVLLGVVDLIGSTVRNNRSESKGGGLHTSLANFNVSDSLIIGNQAELGGGFFQASSNVDGFYVERSSIIDNTVTIFGGGAYAEGNLSKGVILNSTVSGNQASLFGAGIILNAGGRIDVLHTAIVENVSTDFFNSVGGFNAFAGTHWVDLVIDNSLGTLATPAMDLTLYLTIQGSAALDVDYSTGLAVPTVVTFNAGNWPAPGTTQVVEIELNVIDDLLLEGNETVELGVTLTGPGVLGAVTQHTVTIIDDEQEPFSCNGFLPPFSNPRKINRKSYATIPVKMRLFDAFGGLVTDAHLLTPPEIVVTRGGVTWGDSGDDVAITPVGSSNVANLFMYSEEDELWIYRLKTEQFSTPRTYAVSVRSGDSGEYGIIADGLSCTQIFTRK